MVISTLLKNFKLQKSSKSAPLLVSIYVKLGPVIRYHFKKGAALMSCLSDSWWYRRKLEGTGADAEYPDLFFDFK